MFRTKDLTDEQADCLLHVLEMDYRAKEADRKATQEEKQREEYDPKRVVQLYVDDMLSTATSCLHKLKNDIKKCLQYVVDPSVDPSIPFIYSSIVTRFPPIVESEWNGSKVNRVVLKTASLSIDDPYSFKEWNSTPLLLTGEVNLIGSIIYEYTIRICDASFQTSEKPVFQFSSSSAIILPQIQSVQSLLCSLQSELLGSVFTSLDVCCSTLSSILQQLLTIRQYLTTSPSSPFHALTKDYCVRFSVQEGRLQTEVAQVSTHKGDGLNIPVDGQSYSVVQRVKSSVVVEFYQDLKSIVDSHVQTISILLHNCRVFEQS